MMLLGYKFLSANVTLELSLVFPFHLQNPIAVVPVLITVIRNRACLTVLQQVSLSGFFFSLTPHLIGWRGVGWCQVPDFLTCWLLNAAHFRSPLSQAETHCYPALGQFCTGLVTEALARRMLGCSLTLGHRALSAAPTFFPRQLSHQVGGSDFRSQNIC